jgi:hypothetical protein
MLRIQLDEKSLILPDSSTISASCQDCSWSLTAIVNYRQVEQFSGDLLDREKAYLVATPFKKRGKRILKISDFIFALSLDLKWGSPEKVRALLREAEAAGMVKIDGEMVSATFEEKEVEIPLGFKPTSEESILERGIRYITAQTGMSKKEVIALANERQDDLKKLVDLEAVVLLVGREMGLDVRALAEEAYQNLLKRAEDGSGS